MTLRGGELWGTSTTFVSWLRRLQILSVSPRPLTPSLARRSWGEASLSSPHMAEQEELEDTRWLGLAETLTWLTWRKEVKARAQESHKQNRVF